MKKLASLVFIACAALSHAPVSTAAAATPLTYSNLVWQFTTTAPAFASCTQVLMDATGDLVNSENLILAGAINCGSFGYSVFGAGYIARNGTLNFTISHGGYTTDCSRLVNFAGSCTTYDGAGVQRGVGTIRLR